MNNPTMDAETFLETLVKNDNVSYVAGQLERGDKEGTLHL